MPWCCNRAGRPRRVSASRARVVHMAIWLLRWSTSAGDPPRVHQLRPDRLRKSWWWEIFATEIVMKCQKSKSEKSTRHDATCLFVHGYWVKLMCFGRGQSNLRHLLHQVLQKKLGRRDSSQSTTGRQGPSRPSQDALLNCVMAKDLQLAAYACGVRQLRSGGWCLFEILVPQFLGGKSLEGFFGMWGNTWSPKWLLPNHHKMMTGFCCLAQAVALLAKWHPAAGIWGFAEGCVIFTDVHWFSHGLSHLKPLFLKT